MKFMLHKRADAATIPIPHPSQLSVLLSRNMNSLKFLANTPCFFWLCASLCTWNALSPLSAQFIPVHSVSLSSDISYSRELLHTPFIIACDILYLTYLLIHLHLPLDYEFLRVRNSVLLFAYPKCLAKCLEYSLCSVTIEWMKVYIHRFIRLHPHSWACLSSWRLVDLRFFFIPINNSNTIKHTLTYTHTQYSV